MLYPAAVSYTHLDVYKRQLCEFRCGFCIRGSSVFLILSNTDIRCFLGIPPQESKLFLGKAAKSSNELQSLPNRGCLLYTSSRLFRLGVADDNIVIRNQERIGEFTLCGKGFTGTGSTHNQSVGVLELLSVHHDKVVRQSIQPVIELSLIHILCSR